MYNSFVFIIVTELHNCHHNQFENILITPERNPTAISSHVPETFWSLAAANLLSISMDVSIPGILYKWYHLIYGLCAWLLSRHHAFKVRPCCGVYQYFHFYLFLNNILSYDYVTVSLSIHQFMDI